MINHFRTCLLNRPYTFYGDSITNEYTDINFERRHLSPNIASIYTAIFGETPTGDLLNYRFRQIYMLFKACDLVSQTLLDDPRTTYAYKDTALFDGTIVSPDADTIINVINRSLELPIEVYYELFNLCDRPEYEDAYKSITDSIYKFCVLLLTLSRVTYLSPTLIQAAA